MIRYERDFNNGSSLSSQNHLPDKRGGVMVIQDITERKKAEKTLLQEKSEWKCFAARRRKPIGDTLQIGCMCIYSSHHGLRRVGIDHLYERSDEDPDLLVPTDIWQGANDDRYSPFVDESNKTSFRRGRACRAVCWKVANPHGRRLSGTRTFRERRSRSNAGFTADLLFRFTPGRTWLRCLNSSRPGRNQIRR